MVKARLEEDSRFSNNLWIFQQEYPWKILDHSEAEIILNDFLLKVVIPEGQEDPRPLVERTLQLSHTLMQKNLPTTPEALADEICKRFPGRILYGNQTNCWWVWDGRIYVRDSGEKVLFLIQDMHKILQRVQKVIAEDSLSFPERIPPYSAAELRENNKAQKIDANLYPGWKTFWNFMHDMDKSLSSVKTWMQDKCLFDVTNFDPEGNMCFTLEDGVIDLKEIQDTRNVTLWDHDMRRLPTCVASGVKWFGWTYEERRTNPHLYEWDYYIESALPDKELRTWLQAILGHALLGSPTLKGYVNLAGETSTGKSVLINMLNRIFGSYQDSAGIKDFTEGNTDQYRGNKMRGKRLVTSTEPTKGKKLDEGYLKGLTGRDDQVTRAPYENKITWTPQMLIVIASNSVLRFNTEDKANTKRFYPVEFPVTFSDTPNYEAGEKLADQGLEKRLLESERERSRAFEWLLEGLLIYFDNNKVMPVPQAMLDSKDSLIAEMNSALTWAEERFQEFVDGLPERPASYVELSGKVDGRDYYYPSLMLRKRLPDEGFEDCPGVRCLYPDYKAWAKFAGYKPLGEVAFGENMNVYHGNGTRRSTRKKARSYIENLIWVPLDTPQAVAEHLTRESSYE